MFKILIAEDDIELRQLFYRVLTLHGYSAICVSDGKEALDVLDKEYVDLIISDIMMPNMNGYELASSLRESGITIPIPVSYTHLVTGPSLTSSTCISAPKIPVSVCS